MTARLDNNGIKEGLILEVRQAVQLTKIVCLAASFIYVFYIIYGVLIDSRITTALSAFFLTLSGVAYLLNGIGRNSLAKTMILLVGSISIIVTYHVYTLSEAVLTSFFPILLSFPFLFNFATERKFFIRSFSLTIFIILAGIILPRYVLYKVELSGQIAQNSDRIHIILMLVTTAILLYVIIKNKNKVNLQLKKQKDELQKALNDLQSTQGQLIQAEKMATLGLLTAGINHEINNPLNFLKGGLENIRRIQAESDSSEIEPFLHVIDEGINRISKIVKSLNHFNYQSGDLQMECDMHFILDNCLVMLAHQSGGIKISKNYCSSAYARGNPGMLHQVFLNLLINAIQAIDERGEIQLTTHISGDKINIQIKDNGPGIPKSDLNKIFDPFYTTKEPGKGTGLGLPICKRIINEHGGIISVSSEPGFETEFSVELSSY